MLRLELLRLTLRALAASASNARNAFGSKSPPSLALNSSRLVVRERTSSSALL
jgi:hypothetical protein